MDENLDTQAQKLRILREKRKLVEAKSTLKAFKVQHAAAESKMKLKEFCLYILPALLQISAAVIGLIILINGNFFENSSKLLDARNIELKISNDRLDGRRTSLHRSIQHLEKKVNNVQIQYENALRSKSQLDSANKRLSGSYSVVKGELKNLESATLQDAIDNYINGVYWINNKQVNALKNTCRKKLKGHLIIRSYLDSLYRVPLVDKSDQLTHYGRKVKNLVLKYFCFQERRDKQLYAAALNKYLYEFNDKNPDYLYDQNFLNLLISEEWSSSEINENIRMLVRDNYYKNNPAKLLQAYEWATFYTCTYIDKYPLINIDYQAKVHSFLLKELSMLIDGLNYIPINSSGFDADQYKTHIQRCLIVLLAECPQAYFAIESRVSLECYRLQKNQIGSPLKASFNFELDTVSKRIVGDGTFAYYKKSLLLNTAFIEANSNHLDAFLKTNSINQIPDPITGEDFNTSFNKEYVDYWEQRSGQVQYWLSDVRSQDFKSRDFVKRVRTLKL